MLNWKVSWFWVRLDQSAILSFQRFVWISFGTLAFEREWSSWTWVHISWNWLLSSTFIVTETPYPTPFVPWQFFYLRRNIPISTILTSCITRNVSERDATSTSEFSFERTKLALDLLVDKWIFFLGAACPLVFHLHHYLINSQSLILWNLLLVSH